MENGNSLSLSPKYTGILTVNTLPFPTSLSTSIVPLNSSANRFVIESPNHVPLTAKPIKGLKYAKRSEPQMLQIFIRMYAPSA